MFKLEEIAEVIIGEDAEDAEDEEGDIDFISFRGEVFPS
jgi:hypothetical protein